MFNLLNLIPGFSQAKLVIGLIFIVVIGGTIGTLLYQKSQLENTVLTKQNQLDKAKNVIDQVTEANHTLQRTIETKKQEIKTIISEQENARNVDTTTSVKQRENLEQIERSLDAIQSNTEANDNEYDNQREEFLKKYNDNLKCRMENPNSLTACQ